VVLKRRTRESFLAGVRSRVDAVHRVAAMGDYHAASRMEYELWRDVLAAVGGGMPGSPEIALAAIMTAAIDFPRNPA